MQVSADAGGVAEAVAVDTPVAMLVVNPVASPDSQTSRPTGKATARELARATARAMDRVMEQATVSRPSDSRSRTANTVVIRRAASAADIKVVNRAVIRADATGRIPVPMRGVERRRSL